MRKPNRRKAICHPDKPHAAKGYCSACYAKWLKEQNPEYAANQKANRKEWLLENPDYEKGYKKEEIARKGGPEYQRRLDLKKLYGITTEYYDRMLESQDGRCAICKQPPSGKRKSLCVDHCHETGEIRGLLCLACNWGLGYFKDSVENLHQAVSYLQQTKGSGN